MPPNPNLPLKPSHLSTVLKKLNASPKLELTGVKSLKLTLAQRNDHWGARHFMKEHLPRIKWINKSLNIEVEKVPKTATEVWRPELELRFDNGKTHTMNLDKMWSSTIACSLMDIAGAPSWTAWKVHAEENGLPVIPGEEEVPRDRVLHHDTLLPSFAQFRQSIPTTPEPAESPQKPGQATPSSTSSSVSGPGAVLP